MPTGFVWWPCFQKLPPIYSREGNRRWPMYGSKHLFVPRSIIPCRIDDISEVHIYLRNGCVFSGPPPPKKKGRSNLITTPSPLLPPRKVLRKRGFRGPKTPFPLILEKGVSVKKIPFLQACVRARGKKGFSTPKPSFPENGDSGPCLESGEYQRWQQLGISNHGPQTSMRVAFRGTTNITKR